MRVFFIAHFSLDGWTFDWNSNNMKSPLPGRDLLNISEPPRCLSRRKKEALSLDYVTNGFIPGCFPYCWGEISGQMEYYFTNLGFPEIAGDFPYFSPAFGVKTRVWGRYNLTRNIIFLSLPVSPWNHQHLPLTKGIGDGAQLHIFLASSEPPKTHDRFWTSPPYWERPQKQPRPGGTVHREELCSRKISRKSWLVKDRNL